MSKKGDAIATKILEKKNVADLERCKDNFRDVITLSNCDSRIMVEDLRYKLSSLWNSIKNWKLVHLVRAILDSTFALAKDLCGVREFGI